MTGRPLTPVEKARWMLTVSVVVTALLYAIPQGRYLAYPLMLLSTLVHELGHGAAALLTGGRFDRFLMWPDGSGVAHWRGSSSRWVLALVAAGGLVGPALAAAVTFMTCRDGRGARLTLGVWLALLSLALLLVVRNGFGVLFVGVLIAGGILLWRFASEEMIQLALVFFAVQLALSVFSRGDYLFTPVARTAGGGQSPSDVGHMAQALWLPYWFWGLACGAFSLAVLVFGVRVYWRR